MKIRRQMSGWWWLGITATLIVVIATAALQAPKSPQPSRGSPCQATIAGATYSLDAEQAINATTVAAVGQRLGLPDHAVTVALAAAGQESALHNLTYGDRDSVGLFQQRPSEGWGTRSQILSTRYATAAFYDRLTRVPNWQTMTVTEAAQAVQHSGAPAAYAQWETEARLLARTLTGQVGPAFTCRVTTRPGPVLALPLAATMRAELGAPTLEVDVAPARGWAIASWLVAHAATYRIWSISFADQRWSTTTGAWDPHTSAGARVRINVS
jgi:hypothetical protein